MSILHEAHALVNGDRQKAYGHPLDDFSTVAGMLTYLFKRRLKDGEEFDAEDIPLIMLVMKLVREEHRHGHDNLVDLAGYAGTLELVHLERQRRATERYAQERRAEQGHDGGPGEEVGAGGFVGRPAEELQRTSPVLGYGHAGCGAEEDQPEESSDHIVLRGGYSQGTFWKGVMMQSYDTHPIESLLKGKL